MSCRLANGLQVRALPMGRSRVILVAGEGFEPSKAEPGDLQSPPIGRSGNPPCELLVENFFSAAVVLAYGNKGRAMRPIHSFPR